MKIEVKLHDLPEVWEMQPGEPPKEFEAFRTYRDMKPGERSINKVREKVGKKWGSRYETWSSKWKWVDRSGQYDAYLDKQSRELDEKERKEMSAMHIKAARAMMSKALKALQAIAVEDMTANDISRMIEVASKLERISRGETTESVETFGKEGAPSAVQIYIPSNGREKKS